MTKPTSGYVNGSDILLSVGGKAVGHCTTHTITFNSETKDRAVKPAAANGYSAGLWKGLRAFLSLSAQRVCVSTVRPRTDLPRSPLSGVRVRA